MENLPVYVLVLYHFLFFWKAYTQPLQYARGELLSTFFPSFIHLGRPNGERLDPYYWIRPMVHPVLSVFYPSQLLLSKGLAGRDLRVSFYLYHVHAIGHLLGGSLGWYWLFSLFLPGWASAFGAVTMTYSGYNIKQQPCVLYTVAWLPFLLLGIVQQHMMMSTLSFGMILLAGYYPVGIQIFLLALAITGLFAPSFWIWIPAGL